MKILSISSDRKVLEQGSAVRARLVDYGKFVDELHVIVFAKRSLKLSEQKIEPNIFLYPTNSFTKLFYVFAAVSIARLLKRRGVLIDLVTTQDPFESGLAGYVIARLIRVRLHLQIHTDVMSPYFAKESLLNRLRVVVAKILLPRAHGIRVVSLRIKKSIEGLVRPQAHIDVLPILVAQTLNEEIQPEKDLKKKYSQFDFRALVVSRLSFEKNVGSAIEVMASLAKINPRAGLIIVGDGPEKGRLQKLVISLGLEKTVIFEGWQENIFSYYKTADLLVMPSFYEGYGMAAVEALIAGCPVVMSEVGVAGEEVKDGQNGLVVPVGDTRALAQAIARVASHEVKFEVKSPKLPTKEEYLVAYWKSWQNALL